MRQIAHNLIKVLITASLSSAIASPLVHEFSNPSFNGNAGQHWLSIEKKLFEKKQEIKDRERAKVEKDLALLGKTNIAKFFKNVEARIYAQLSKQLVDQMFGETSSTSGTVEIEGNTITYLKDGENVTLTVVNENGQTTEIVLPINSFTF
jgi:hypothetical protein